MGRTVPTASSASRSENPSDIRALTASPASARLFLLGIVLCDNEPTLVRIKGVDFAEVRRTMKQAHASLFAAYLRLIERRVPGRS